MDTEETGVPSGSPEQAGDGTQESQSDQSASEDTLSQPDLSDVPEEYRDAVAKAVEGKAKALQADYTRKTQAVADRNREAEAFRNLMGDDRIAQVIDNMVKYGTPTAPTPQAQAPRRSGEDIILDIINGGEDALDKLIAERAERIVNERVSPIAEANAAREAEAEILRMSQKYPDFEEHGDAIASILQSSGYSMTPEQAYRLATWDTFQKKGAAEAAKSAGNRAAAAGATKGSSAPVTTEKAPSNMYEAFELAKKQMGR